MTISFEVIDDKERFEAAENVLEDGNEIYCLRGDKGFYTVSVYGLAGILATAHNEKHREELRRRTLSHIYEGIAVDGVDSGVFEANYASLAEVVSMDFTGYDEE